MRMSPDFTPQAQLWITRGALVGTGALASLGIVHGVADTDTARGETPAPAGAQVAQAPGSGIGIPGWPNCRVIVRDGTAVMEGVCPEDAEQQPAPPAEPEAAEPAPEDAEPAPKPKPKPKKNKPAQKPKNQHRNEPRNNQTVSYNMNNPRKWGSVIDSNGCGVVSLADTASYLTGDNITPTKVHPLVYRWYTPSGQILASPYMRQAAPAVAKRYGLQSYETDSLRDAMKALKVGGAAIILAEAGIFTGGSHYMALQGFRKGRDGKAYTKLQDPNQTSTRSFDGSWHSVQYFLNNNVQDRAWVMKNKRRR